MLAWIAVLAAGAGSCTNDSLDDGGSADVVLEVLSLENPAVTGEAAQSGFCSLDGSVACTTTADCAGAIPPAGLCEAECVGFVVQEWSATLGNAPKNVLAGGDSTPFNDVTLESVTITYSWLDPAVSTPTRTVGLGNVTIPTDGTSSVTFAPIAFDDLSLSLEGHTANLSLVFRAKTVEGTRITDTVSRQLFVEACTL
jgi:hypothetical protein